MLVIHGNIELGFTRCMSEQKYHDLIFSSALMYLQSSEQEEWKPLALMVAEFEASTPARFNHGPRAVQYVPPAQPDSNARAGVKHLQYLNWYCVRPLCIQVKQCNCTWRGKTAAMAQFSFQTFSVQGA